MGLSMTVKVKRRVYPTLPVLHAGSSSILQTLLLEQSISYPPCASLYRHPTYVRFSRNLHMEHSKSFRGVDTRDHSAHTSQHHHPVRSHDLENNNAPSPVTHEKAPQDSNIVDWNGPDDPENPLNWPSAKKITAISIVSLICMLS